MGSCLSSGQKSRINYNLSVTSSSSNKEVDNCAKSAVKDSQLDLMQLMQPLQSFKQTSTFYLCLSYSFDFITKILNS